MRTTDIRKKFLTFFKEHGHTILPSSSLLPKNDPTLLFTNAGMVQFKNIFQGQEQPLFTTVATSQKCLRAGGKHNDLENVGRTARHHTFFEMLGNFSFGEYFKKEAILLAWQFITEELKLDKNTIYVTVFLDDDDAYTIWHKECGIPTDHIKRLGEKDNFWSMGDTGPCGPCSEIFIDQGAHLSCGTTCGIGSCDCDRYLEIWNLVFMQFDQHHDGSRTLLPKLSIDTGAGLERLTAVCQGVYSNYDTDLFQDIIQFISSLTNNTYIYKAGTEEIDTALRVIADHSRAIVFMLSDGMLPSNEGRGYVLRRIIRRAYRFGRELSLHEPFLYKVIAFVAQLMGSDYPELLTNIVFLQEILKKEEEAFNRTLDKGLILLEELLEQETIHKNTLLSGENAFLLHDTYGFPVDILHDILEKRAFSFDIQRFEQCIEEQKQRARASWKGAPKEAMQSIFLQLAELSPTKFEGYSNCTTDSHIIKIFSVEGIEVKSLLEDTYGYIVTSSTPFYPVGGGQEGDVGTITTQDAIADVLTTEKAPSEAIIHHVHITKGMLTKGNAQLCVSEEIRKATIKNHTATHLTFAVLREYIGDHIRQAGSLVTHDKLRFDFTHIQALTQEEINEIERRVNYIIQEAIPAHSQEMDYNDAIELGAISLAGETYTEAVRVIAFGDISTELCCGTHVENTGEIGVFIIISETGLATGIRRIEALTGQNALSYIQENRKTLSYIASDMKCPLATVQTSFSLLQKEKKQLQKEYTEIKEQLFINKGKELIQKITSIGEYTLLTECITNASVQELKIMMDTLRPHSSNGIILLASKTTDSIQILLYVAKNIHTTITAKDIFQKIAPYIDAKGGGKTDMIQAGGTKPEGMQKMFATLKEIVSSL